MLQAFHRRCLAERNRSATMLPVREANLHLLEMLRQPVSVSTAPRLAAVAEQQSECSLAVVVEEASEPSVPLPTSSPALLQAGAAVEDNATRVQVSKKRKRNPAMCRVCGHARYLGRFGAAGYHDRNAARNAPAFCRVPVEDRVPQELRRKGWCDCAECGLRSYGLDPSPL